MPKSMSVLIVAGFLSAPWLLFAGTVSAQPIDPAQACTGDAMRLCSALIPDQKKITACLRKNRSALSPDCRKVFSGGRKAKRHRT